MPEYYRPPEALYLCPITPILRVSSVAQVTMASDVQQKQIKVKQHATLLEPLS